MAWARSAPMIQVVPLESRARMKAIAQIAPSSEPSPVRVTVPSAAMLPP